MTVVSPAAGTPPSSTPLSPRAVVAAAAPPSPSPTPSTIAALAEANAVVGPPPRRTQRMVRLESPTVEPIRAPGKRRRQAILFDEEEDEQEPKSPSARRVRSRFRPELNNMDGDPLAPFDSDGFIEAMAAEKLMDSVEPDGINMVEDGVDAGNENESEPSGSEVEDTDPFDDEFDDDYDNWGTERVEDTSFVESEHFAEATQGYVSKQYLVTLGNEGWTTYENDQAKHVTHPAATDLYSGPSGPTKSAVAFAESPLGMFFYFMPKSMWIYIAEQCNRYRDRQLPLIAEARHKRMLKIKKDKPAFKVKEPTEILEELKKSKPIEAHEILHYLGLLIARVLTPHRDGLRRHWSTVPDGATPPGTFGRYMKRKRFEEIGRFLHFSDNSIPESGVRDRARKICPVLQVLEKTFRRGYRLGAHISFDEGMIPKRSRFNPIRVYMAAKPNKWGTKFFLTCCAETAYCSRVEVYCGAEDKVPRKKGEPKVEDPSATSALVIRNITKALKGLPAKRLIITDNYYTSVSLALKLLSLGFYTVGTVRTNRLGWCDGIAYTQKTRPKTIARGTYRMATASVHPISPEVPTTATATSSPATKKRRTRGNTAAPVPTATATRVPSDQSSTTPPAPPAPTPATKKSRAKGNTAAPQSSAPPTKKSRARGNTAAPAPTATATRVPSDQSSTTPPAPPAPTPDLVAVSWMDSKPVNFLATGCATTLVSVERKEKDGTKTAVPCPQLVVDYHKGMGGVDVHDQLRLQRYSIQKCVRFKKYYKALFLGLVDMALINGYIVHKIALKRADKKPVTHANYMNQLHKSLLVMTKTDLTTNPNAENLIANPIQPATHTLVQMEEMYTGGDHPKRRQYRCKVCAAYNIGKKTCSETSWFCQLCSDRVGGLVSLCDRARRKEEGNTLTCSDVWHKTWENGTAIPAALRRKIRFRKHNSNGGGNRDEDGEEDEDDEQDED